MDKKSRKKAPAAPRQGIWSRLTYSWLSGFVFGGWKQTLRIADLHPLDDQLRSEELTSRFFTEWDKRHQTASGSHVEVVPRFTRFMFQTLFATFRGPIVVSAVYQVVSEVCAQTTPYVQQQLIALIESRDTGTRLGWPGTAYGYGMCVAMFVLQSVKAICYNQSTWIMYCTGLKIRTAMSGAIYQKIFRMSDELRQEYTAGKVVSLVSADVCRIESTAGYFHLFWFGPLQVLLTVALLYRLLGWSALAGAALITVAVPVQALLVRLLAANRENIGHITDKRIRLLQEMLTGIRVIKLYAWEDLFLQRLNELRSQEMRLIWRQNLFSGLSVVLASTLTAFASVIGYAVYVGTGQRMTADVVFSALAYFNMLDIPLSSVPPMVNAAVDSHAAIGRIHEFLSEDHFDFGGPKRNTHLPAAVVVEGGRFEWSSSKRSRAARRAKKPKAQPHTGRRNSYHHKTPGEDPSHPAPNRILSVTPSTTYNMEEHTWMSSSIPPTSLTTLTDISLTIPRGKLVAVVGPVGSGKSSLLSAILGDMPCKEGKVTLGDDVALCPQQAWIQNASIRDNILFGQPYDEGLYRAVLKQCQMEADLASLPYGDLTEIGEKGTGLSGGQKARINVARVVYSQKKIALLDDPLSAVDPQVSNAIFHNCIYNGLLQNKTRILVTHKLAFLPYCDYIVVMRSGTIAEQGSYCDLMAQESSFSELMRQYLGEEADYEEEEEEIEEEADEEYYDEEYYDEEGYDEEGYDKEGASLTMRSRSVQIPVQAAEPVKVSSPSLHVYRVYTALAGGWLYVLVVVAVVVLAEMARTGKDIWLTMWVDRQIPSFSERQYIYSYALIAAAISLFTWINVLVFYGGGRRVAQRLHTLAAESLFRCSIRFFESTPLGRIINRFSRDQDVVDNQLSDDVYFFLFTIGTIVSAILLIAITSWRVALILVMPICASFLLQSLYRTCSRLLHKFYAVALSPYMSHFSETYSGLKLVHAYGRQRMFIDRYHHCADNVSRSAYLSLSLRRWASVRSEMVGAALMLAVSVSCFYFGISANLTGLILSTLVGLCASLDWFIKQLADTETNMVAVERLDHYARELVGEDFATPSLSPLPPSWPAGGRVEFKDLTVSYPLGLQPIIFAINAVIDPGEKVAIVGRTGAGKSTILSAMFRLVEPSGGTILIDRVDIRAVSLGDLRERLSVVPQDPVLFSGTVRFNLDPRSTHPDVRLWQVLDRVGMHRLIAANEAKLDMKVKDFSGGQKQLLCLARAMLKQSAVVLMDEPTASMDVETDQKVQDVLWNYFGRSTILTITHRLDSIANFDKVMVLDHGKIVEFDAPDVLLANPDSYLSGMVAESDDI